MRVGRNRLVLCKRTRVVLLDAGGRLNAAALVKDALLPLNNIVMPNPDLRTTTPVNIYVSQNCKNGDARSLQCLPAEAPGLVLKALKIFVGVDNIFLSCVRRVDVEKAARPMVKTLARRGWIWVQERLVAHMPGGGEGGGGDGGGGAGGGDGGGDAENTEADLAEGSEAAMEAAATAAED